MKTVVSSLHFQIPAGAAPEWVHLTPAGTFSGADGRGPYRVEDAQAIIRSSMAAGKLAIDENHAIDKAAPEGRPAPARGWIVAMEARDDGIWGRVEWTGEGKRLVDDHAYRGFSPVFVSEKASGKVLRILRGALTNDPNLTLTTLHNRENDMTFHAQLRKALGLKDDAAEDAVLTSVTSHAAIAAAHLELAVAAGLKADATPAALLAQVTAHAADAGKLAAIASHFTSAGLELSKLTPKDLETQLQARGAGGDAELRRTVIELQSQLATLQTDTAKDKAIAFVDAAIAAGKPIKPLRDHYITRHQKDAAGVETEINALVSIHSGTVKQPKSSERDALDADEQAVVNMMGLDPKKFAETRADLEKTAL